MKNAFLFGAGAEGEGNFGLSLGADFARKILLSREPTMNNINRAIKSYYKLKSLNEWYPSYGAEGWNEKQLIRGALRKRALEKNRKGKVTGNEVGACLNNGDAKEKLFEKYFNYMGLADERYHTLINPKVLGSKKFWSVINCYTRAYLLIAGQMLGKEEESEYLDILKHPKETYAEMRREAELRRDNESYYKMVRELSPNSLVITTNYTPYAEIVTGQETTINIHGDFSLFESARELRVYKVEDDLPENEVLFPYISIQGGVKPIVERKQMMLYGCMVTELSECDRIIIVGYNLNSDDNHLNSVLRSFLVEDKKKIIFFDFDGKGPDELKNKLRIDDGLCVDLETLNITKDNAFEKFANCLIL